MGFQPSSSTTIIQQQQKQQIPKQRQTKLYVFGLGGPEIAVILIAGAFLLGPQKLAELGKDAGKIAGELKEVPKEFQAGLAEGEKEGMKMKSSISKKSSEVQDVSVTTDD